MKLLIALALAASSVSAVETIPYDQTLVLGNIIDPKRIDALEKVCTLQKKVNAAEDKYSALMRSKMSLSQDIQELLQLGIQADKDADWNTELKETDKKIVTALKEKVKARNDYQNQYQALLAVEPQTTIGTEPASPLDWEGSKMDYLDLSSDSMNMHVQFFQVEKTDQGATAHTQKISSFVQHTIGSLFDGSAGSSVAAEAASSTARTMDNHELDATLVVAITATHKKAQQFTTQKYDTDKLVAAWNAKVPSEKIDLPKDTQKLYEEYMSGKMGGTSMQLLSGRTFGSSFVGFVHFANVKHTSSHQDMESHAESAQTQATYGNLFASITGKFGMDSESAKSVKSLLSSVQLQTHVSVITMGIIPSMASNNVDTAISEFTTMSPADIEDKLNILSSSNDAKAPDMDSQARQAIRAGQIKGVEKGRVEAVLDGVQKGDTTSNQVYDTNTLMRALDDYVALAREIEGGVPTNFYVSTITKKAVISNWFGHYRPDLKVCTIYGTNSDKCTLTGGSGKGGDDQSSDSGDSK